MGPFCEECFGYKEHKANCPNAPEIEEGSEEYEPPEEGFWVDR